MTLGAAQTHLVVPHGITAWDWIHVGVILAVTALATQASRRAVMRAAAGGGHDRAWGRLLSRFLTYVIVVAGLVYSLVALRVQIGPLLGALGIGGIALAFALQDTLQNFVAGVLLQARRPIRRGDQVLLDNKFEGIVEDIDLRNVVVRTYDGLDVFIPNKTVLENPIVNYTRTPLRRTSLEVGVGYGIDLGEAQRVLLDATRRTTGVKAMPPPAAWVREFGDSSVRFTLLFWHSIDPWRARSDVAMAVKAALDEAAIAMPFPQRDVWVRAPGPDAREDALVAGLAGSVGDGWDARGRPNDRSA
ncbi:MAG TPA: mechanosensitive ion channel family protein [Actinomycetota bacterium]|nr:mechanosensitive ion channel family protein [Actinomycetota bacterium]